MDGGTDGGEETRIEGQLSVFYGMPSSLVSADEPGGVPIVRRPRDAFGELLAQLAPPGRAPNRWPEGEQVVHGEVIVRLPESLVSEEAARARVALPGWTVRHGGYASPYLHLMRFSTTAEGRVPGVLETLRLVERVAALSGVDYAEPNRLRQAAAVPNDRYYALQWNFPAMNLPAAWDLTTGSAGIVVAVLDTGSVSHTDLNARTVAGIDMISDAARAGDGNGRDDDPTDMGKDRPGGSSSWHGTFVAGVIGAATNNGSGVAGVDWKARLQHVRVLGKGGGTDFDILAGVQWASGGSVPNARANSTPASVLNLSLGGDGSPTKAAQEVIDAAVTRGAVVVVAAGNEDEDTALKFPCNQDKVICVGATRLSGKRASYSNYGSAVDVMAPGGEMGEDLNGDGNPDGILSTSGGAEPYVFSNGTSAAAPHVAGLVALMRAANGSLTPAQVEATLKSTAMTASRCTEGCGAGLVSAQAAVAAATGGTNPGPPKLSLTTTELYLTSATPGVVGVSNVGGQKLTVTAAAQGLQAGRLSFPAGATLAVDPGKSATLLVAANLNGLTPGVHAASVRLETNGGAATVNVRLSAGDSAVRRPAVLGFLYEDEEGEWQVAGGGEVRPEDDYRYSFPVPPGTYYVFAAVDEDDDGDFSEPGEPVGLYRTRENPQKVSVAKGRTLKGIDFALVPQLPPDETPALVVGAPCTGDGACADGGVCETSFPGGYCTRECGTRPCPTGARCVGSTSQWCVASCVQPGGGQSNCRPGYVCYDDYAGGGSCWPRCTGPADCTSGTTCDSGSGYCRPAASSLVIGSTCSAHADCVDGGVCITDFPGGYCTRECSSRECPESGVCVDFDEGLVVCLARCPAPRTGRSTCRASYICEDMGSGVGACWVRCASDDECAEGYSCNTSTGYCG